uniref:helix-turn-helix domain-containing protein n=1 Tax=Salmonella enterica TaxID=28901 RepID=UPI00352434ED
MSVQKSSDEQIIAAMKKHNSVSRAAQELGLGARQLHNRISVIEGKLGHKLRLHAGIQHAAKVRINRDNRPNPIEMPDGIIIVASDCHYWPGDASAGHRALVK